MKEVIVVMLIILCADLWKKKKSTKQKQQQKTTELGFTLTDLPPWQVYSSLGKKLARGPCPTGTG